GTPVSSTLTLVTFTPGRPPRATLPARRSSGRTTDLSNTASASTTTTDNDLTNNSATETTQVKTQADIYVTKSDSPDPVLAGNNLTYTLGVHNGGPSDALGVVLSDPIPAGTSFFSATGGGTYSGITKARTSTRRNSSHVEAAYAGLGVKKETAR